MKLYGLTGGVGMGKSTIAGLLRSRCVPVVDTDDLAREVVAPGQPALLEIIAAFGSSLVDSTGQLRRAVLAELVFADPEARRALEAITHPRIRQLWQQQVQTWRQQEFRVGVVVIPLLFETGAETEFDRVICVACTDGAQRERLRSRGWSQVQIAQRIQSQMPIQEKLARAQFGVWTEGELAVSEQQLAKIIPP